MKTATILALSPDLRAAQTAAVIAELRRVRRKVRSWLSNSQDRDLYDTAIIQVLSELTRRIERLTKGKRK